jgi:hypothetical protein
MALLQGDSAVDFLEPGFVFRARTSRLLLWMDRREELEVSVQVTASRPPARLVLRVGDLLAPVNLKYGSGRLPPLLAETPGVVQIRVENPALLPHDAATVFSLRIGSPGSS